jgi:hypothetical protein
MLNNGSIYYGVDYSNFDMKKINNLNSQCAHKKVFNITNITNFDTSSIKSFRYTFFDSKITNAIISYYNLDNAEDLQCFLLSGTTSDKKISFEKSCLQHVDNALGMFAYFRAYTKFSFQENSFMMAKNMSYMFMGTSSTFELNNINTCQATDMSYMFSELPYMIKDDSAYYRFEGISNLGTDCVEDMSYMFYNSYFLLPNGIDTIDLSYNMLSVKNADSMFESFKTWNDTKLIFEDFNVQFDGTCSFVNAFKPSSYGTYKNISKLTIYGDFHGIYFGETSSSTSLPNTSVTELTVDECNSDLEETLKIWFPNAEITFLVYNDNPEIEEEPDEEIENEDE